MTLFCSVLISCSSCLVLQVAIHWYKFSEYVRIVVYYSVLAIF